MFILPHQQQTLKLVCMLGILCLPMGQWFAMNFNEVSFQWVQKMFPTNVTWFRLDWRWQLLQNETGKPALLLAHKWLQKLHRLLLINFVSLIYFVHVIHISVVTQPMLFLYLHQAIMSVHCPSLSESVSAQLAGHSETGMGQTLPSCHITTEVLVK